MKNRNLVQRRIRNRYSKMPHKIFNMGLPAPLAYTYLYLLSLTEDKNPSLSDICKKINISRPTAIRYIKILEKIGFIKRIGRDAKRRTAYELIDVSLWHVENNIVENENV